MGVEGEEDLLRDVVDWRGYRHVGSWRRALFDVHVHFLTVVVEVLLKLRFGIHELSVGLPHHFGVVSCPLCARSCAFSVLVCVIKADLFEKKGFDATGVPLNEVPIHICYNNFKLLLSIQTKL